MNGQIKTDPCKQFYENLSSCSPSTHLDAVKSTILDLEAKSYWNNNGIQIDFAEIEGALKTLKLWRTGGVDGLDPKHIYFGSEISEALAEEIM